MADVLSSAKGGKKKTHIMYRCNLSYRQLQSYLRLLREHGLLEGNGGGFETTNKGVNFLHDYHKLQRHLN